jgi:hypothetical protein
MGQETIYLLCVWIETQDDDDGEPQWRAMLEEPRTGNQWGFSMPGALVSFLEDRETLNGE